MRKLLIVSALLLTACASGTPELGHLMPCKAAGYVAITPSQLSPVCEHTTKGITYRLAANERNRISYLSTRDVKQSTPEGIRVGSTLSHVLKAGGDVPVTLPGFKRYTCLPSGWCVGFAFLDVALPDATSVGANAEDMVIELFQSFDYRSAPN